MASPSIRKGSLAELRLKTRLALEHALKSEKAALDKLEKAEKLLFEAEVKLSNIRRREDLIAAREKKLDRMFVRLNKSRTLVEQRTIRENERDLLLRDNLNKL